MVNTCKEAEDTCVDTHVQTRTCRHARVNTRVDVPRSGHAIHGLTNRSDMTLSINIDIIAQTSEEDEKGNCIQQHVALHRY